MEATTSTPAHKEVERIRTEVLDLVTAHAQAPRSPELASRAVASLLTSGVLTLSPSRTVRR